MPEPNLATPPDVGAWTAARTEADTGVAVETPPAAPVAPAPEAPPAAPVAETPPAGPTTAEQIVAAMVKGGLKADDAQALMTKATTPEPIKDALEAMLDGKPYQVPKNLTFRLKTGNQVAERSLEQLQREGMMAADYQRKTQETAGLRRQLEQRIAQADAQLAAAKERENWLRERETEMIEAQKDPAKWEQYQQTMELYQKNPAFRKIYDDALAARESKAQLTTFEERVQQQEVMSGAEQAMNWIQQLSAEYPGVNPERVRFLYAYALEHGQITSNALESVRQVFEGEQNYIKSAATPYESQLAAMRAELDALKAATDADKHNGITARALERGRAPNVSPVGGSPAAPVKIEAPKPIPPDRHKIDAAITEWSKRRDA